MCMKSGSGNEMLLDLILCMCMCHERFMRIVVQQMNLITYQCPTTVYHVYHRVLIDDVRRSYGLEKLPKLEP